MYSTSRNKEFKDIISNSNTKIIGIAGFTTYVYETQSIERTAKISSHILEDGSNVQDHIAFDPVVMNITGVVSNKFYQGKGQTNQPINRSVPVKELDFLLAREKNSVSEKILNGINGIKKSEIYQLKNVASEKYFKPRQNKNNEDLIQSFIDTLTTCFNNKTMISIDFGYQKFEQVVIEQFSTTQSSVEDALYFTLRFQEIAFARSQKIRTSGSFLNPIKKGSQKGNIKKIAKPSEIKKVNKGYRSTLYNLIFGLFNND